LFSAAPETPYQTIGLVSAKSGDGWTAQQSLDYAIDELKNQAAAVGANGVILGQTGASLGGFIMSEGIAIPYEEQTVSGTAIFLR
jgi:uncharacterized protein YbjQ (UPF0145 family)